MNKKKLMSLILALVMLVGAFAPFGTFANIEEATETKTVTLHKMLMNKENLNAKQVVITTTKTEGGKEVKTDESKVIVLIKNQYFDAKDLANALDKNNEFVKAYKGEALATGKTATVTPVFAGTVGVDGTPYDGNKINNPQAYFGTGAKEADGVYFAWKFGEGHVGYTETETAKIAAGEQTKAPTDIKAGLYVKAQGTTGRDKLAPMTVTYKTTVDGQEVTKTYLVATDKVEDAVGGLTAGGNGIQFATTGLEGKFEIDEIVEKSTYGNGGKILTDSRAVPVKITLPLVNDEGVVANAHVYPKNTDDKPRLDKNFSIEEAKKLMSKDEADKLVAAVAHKKAYDIAVKNYAEDTQEYKDANNAYTQADKELIAKWGIDLSNPTRDKQIVDHKIGDIVEYTVETEIPAKTKWGTAFWDDKMTHGLTFVTSTKAKEGGKYKDKGIVIKYIYDGKEEVMNKDWYTLSETENGFTLELTDAGLKGINGKDKEAKITLTYNAEINNTTVTDIPESNDITFNYGNDKNKGNTPVPVKPNENGEFEVIKKWADGSKLPDGGIDVTFTLYDAQTGKQVTKDDLVAPARGNFKTDAEYEDAKAKFETYKASFQNPVTKHADKVEDINFTWKYLDKNREYKAEEKFIGYAAHYEKTPISSDLKPFKDGSVTVTNTKTNNPEPLNPSEPKVITGGKKFVKTNDKTGKDLERLAGAEFVVTRKVNTDGGEKTQYLALKSGQTAAKEVKDYEAAEKAYNEFIDAYNAIVDKAKADKKGVTYPVEINGESYDNKAAVENKLAELKAERDAKFYAARENYQWIEAKDAKAAKEAGALVLTSDDQGRFEITGLAYGTYTIVEIKAPKGYALPSNAEFEFTVGKDTYKGTKDEFRYTKDIEPETGKELTEEQKTANAKAKADGFGKQIINKKVDIPQTGGIGTVIFTVVGISLMAGAFIAMRKRTAEEN